MIDSGVAPSASVRRADEGDISAILALLLTSFRQFPLFTSLYAPLDDNKDAAYDTVFFWGRRVLLGLLDPSVAVLVAEADVSLSATPPPSVANLDAIDAESWSMLRWVTERGRLSQISKPSPGKTVVGFAIWREKDDSNPTLGTQRASWIQRIRTTLLNLEISFWTTIYQRRDQDPARYHAYESAEEELVERYHKGKCYYLDNLCVDFRCQRLGIGKLLLQWGLDRARSLQLPVGTEAGPKGEGLYRKMGFEQVGTWKVAMPGKPPHVLEMPVMRLEAP